MAEYFMRSKLQREVAHNFRRQDIRECLGWFLPKAAVEVGISYSGKDHHWMHDTMNNEGKKNNRWVSFFRCFFFFYLFILSGSLLRCCYEEGGGRENEPFSYQMKHKGSSMFFFFLGKARELDVSFAFV